MMLIRNLLGLIITITMHPVCMEAFMYVSDIPFNYNEINDEIALSQLREQLLISYDMYVSSDELNFIYKNKNFKLSMVNNKMIMQPGTQISLNDIDNLNFEMYNECKYCISSYHYSSLFFISEDSLEVWKKGLYRLKN